MTDSTRVVIGRAMAAIAVLGAVVGLIWLVSIGYRQTLWDDWMVHNAIVAVGNGMIVWLVIRSQPRNATIWVLAWAGILCGLEVITYALSAQWALGLGLEATILDLVPSELPTGLALLMMQGNWLWVGVLLSLLTLALFPDGRPPSPRWRWLPITMMTVIGLTAFGLFWEARPSSVYSLVETQDTHGGFRSITASLVTVGYPLIFFLGLACLLALLVRYRRSEGEERQQFRWVAWGASVMTVLMVTALLMDEVGGRTDVSLYVGAVAIVALIASLGIAIGKYRLYDIDVVISRTLVYGALAVFITAVYVGIVVGIGFLIGAQEEPNPWLGILATVVIAIAFQPLRRQLQRLANRVVYGRRATPYEVLSSFSQGVSVVDPGMLTEVARSLAEGTTADSSSIWIDRRGSLQCIAAWPAIVSGDVPPGVSAPVTHHGDRLGLVVVEVAPGQPFPVTDKRLLEQVAAGLGLALRNLLLTEDLRDRVEELAASRRRVVAVQDDTRRKLERDLHDGAQQRLVALKIKLGIGSSLAEKRGLPEVKTMLDAIKEETDDTIESVRDFARGIYPPLLEAEGLVSALNARGRKLETPVTVQAAGLGRYPKDQEAGIYFCVLEALQNATKYSGAESIVVSLEEVDGLLRFEVRDDGTGFDVDQVGGGHGLVNMVDRIEAMGGELRIVSTPGHGTRVVGSIPVPVATGAP